MPLQWVLSDEKSGGAAAQQSLCGIALSDQCSVRFLRRKNGSETDTIQIQNMGKSVSEVEGESFCFSVNSTYSLPSESPCTVLPSGVVNKP